MGDAIIRSPNVVTCEQSYGRGANSFPKQRACLQATTLSYLHRFSVLHSLPYSRFLDVTERDIQKGGFEGDYFFEGFAKTI